MGDLDLDLEAIKARVEEAVRTGGRLSLADLIALIAEVERLSRDLSYYQPIAVELMDALPKTGRRILDAEREIERLRDIVAGLVEA